MEQRYFEATVRALQEEHPDFKSADLSGHDITDDKMFLLSSALANNKKVTTLELFGLKHVTLLGWKAFAEKVPSQLTTLDLGKCELGRENQTSVAAVFSGLSRLPHMEELDLNGNGISQESVPALCSALERMPSLRELMIQNNQLGNLGSKQLADCLAAHNKQLETLWIQNNGLDAAGKTALKQELSSLANLSRVEVGQD
eukprot:TRINITY_DN3928_c0_g1_i1.p1 TRINITY_DN3928_c0_g1~~TRINITY_DN3928_c0_g1_i1.p1  ORF type:complete len:210 (+),score=23.81 TRINITY_DN3928_c0_g1_i1:31-630(+)